MNRSGIDGFDVQRVAVQELEDMNSFIVGLTETQDGRGSVLILSTGLSFDEQDRTLGQDTYSISTEFGATVYGGVTRCILDDCILTVELDAQSAATLGVSRTCQFRLNVDPAAIAQLRQGLTRVFTSGTSLPVDLRL